MCKRAGIELDDFEALFGENSGGINEMMPSTKKRDVAQAYRTVNQTEYESEYDVENKREMEYMKSLRESDPEGYKVYIAGKIEKRKAEGKWIV